LKHVELHIYENYSGTSYNFPFYFCEFSPIYQNWLGYNIIKVFYGCTT